MYYPGMFLQFISTFFIYIIIAAVLGGLGYIYVLGKRVDYLKAALGECETKIEMVENKRTFLEFNLKVLKRNCEREVKPTLVDGKLKVENLFNNDPE